MEMEPTRSSRVERALHDAGIMQPESCSIVLKALEGVRSEDSRKRLVSISRLKTCLEYLRNAGHTQLLLNLAVFLLERGVARGIAAAMWAVAAGEWLLIAPEKDVCVGSKSRLKVMVNNALSCGGCLNPLAADRRCVSTILKDFPDLARVVKTIFVTKFEAPDIRFEHPAEFEKLVKWAMMGVLVPVVAMSPRFQRQLAEDFRFVRELLGHAERVREDAAQAEVYTGSLSLIHNVMLEDKPNLAALTVDLLNFLGTILATSTSREHVEMATRMLVMLPEDQHGPRSSTFTAAGVRYPLASSLLAILSLGRSLHESVWCFAEAAAKTYWRDELAGVDGVGRVETFFEARFQRDERAKSRATELSRIFSETCVEPRRHYQLKRANVEDNPENPLRSLPFKERLECRKCSRTGCESLEAEAGTFQVCGRCKMAVYCSRDCQKRAWKEGHRELCH